MALFPSLTIFFTCCIAVTITTSARDRESIHAHRAVIHQPKHAYPPIPPASLKFQFEKPLGGKTYFDTLRQSQELVKGMQILRNNATSRGHVEQVLGGLSSVELLGSAHALHELGFSVEHVWRGVARVMDQQAWDQPCVNDTGRTLRELMKGTSWALQMFDASGKPGPSLSQGRLTWVGNYQQCRDVTAPPDPAAGSTGFKGNFVWLSLYVSAFHYIPLRWSVCMPDSCNEANIYMLVNDTISAYAKPGSIVNGGATIIDNKTEFTGATYATVVIFSIIAALMVIGTVYDIFAVQLPIWEKEKKVAEKEKIASLATNRHNGDVYKNGNGSVYQNGSILSTEGITNGGAYVIDDEKRPLIGRATQAEELGRGSKAILAFSVYTNTRKFLSTAQAPGALTAIHGIRFLSMTWVLLGHIYAFGMQYFENQQQYLQQLLERWTFDAVGNAFPSVDSFYTLSGLLTAYLTVKEMIKIKSCLKLNWGLFYFHRFWRLTPPYMLTLMAFLGLSQYLGGGALWQPTQPQDKQVCEKYWWRNLLYINSITDADEMCFGHSWYLGNDMIFFVISPLLMIPFFFSTRAGVAASTVALTAHWALTGGLSRHHGWPTTTFSAGMTQEMQGDYMDKYYLKPHTRIGPYLVGLLVGGLLARKAIRLNRLSAVLGWLVFTATGLAVVYGLRGDVSGNHVSSVDVAALYNAVSRSAWGACVCWVIVACHQGYGGLVNSLLSWAPFVVLGRLTYMSYLVHPNILYAFYQNLDTLIYLKDFTMIINYLGAIALINMVAFVMMLGLESPMIGLEKALLPSRRK